MKRKDRYFLYILGILVMLFLAQGILRQILPETTGNQEEKLESDLKEKEEGTEQGTVPNEPIRVLLMSSGYTEALHASVSLAADHGLLICYGDQEEEWTDGILTLAPDDARFSWGNLRISALEEEEIRVESIERGCGIPSYEGVIEVWSGEEGMAVINELPLEQYLEKVVPSEMPATYEIEALKAQAVCARSYACRQMADYAYPEYEAHVNDSTEYQVYNNSGSAEAASQAVKETAGQVVRYQGEVAVTYYYSTSCGRTTDMEAWGSTVNEGNAYLQSVEVSDGQEDYEKDLPWYHWRAELSVELLTSLLEEYSGKKLGTLEQLEVTRRGAGDVALVLTATGTEGVVTVETENKIRTALGGTGYQILKNDGTEVESQKLLPSAFFTITKQENSYLIEGGGYGHGIGMSQNGANEMAKCGKTYKEILELFYQNITVE